MRGATIAVAIILGLLALIALFTSVDDAYRVNAFYASVSEGGAVEDLLTPGAYFKYYYSGSQHGKGEWSDYWWDFSEEGVVLIKGVEGDVVKGYLNYTRHESDSEGNKREIRYCSLFVYNLTSDTYVEYRIVGSELKLSLVYRGGWLYRKEGMGSVIANRTFSISRATVRMFGLPVEALVAKREGREYYVEDSILFSGNVEECYWFDANSGMILRYSIRYSDMWNKDGTIGWDYEDEFYIYETNVAISSKASGSELATMRVIAVLSALKLSLLFVGAILAAAVVDVALTRRDINKALRALQEVSVPQEAATPSPYSAEFFFSYWLKPGYVVFRTASGSHVLAYIGEGKEYSKALSLEELNSLVSVLSFSPAYNRAVLDKLSADCKCLEAISGPPQPDEILIKTLRSLSLTDEERLKREEMLASELLDLAYRASGYRKVFSEQFGQAYALPARNVQRALEIYKRLRSGRVLLIGDDDFLSILLAKLGFEVHVVDIDEYVLRMILFLSERFGVADRVRVYRHDIRKPFDLGKFDAVHIDPGYSVDGLALFLSRAVASLAPGGLLFLSWRADSYGKTIVSKVARKAGLRIEGFVPRAVKYVVPLGGYYAHTYSKYGTYAYFQAPRIVVGPWKAGFWVIRKSAGAGYLIGPESGYTGVLY